MAADHPSILPKMSTSELRLLTEKDPSKPGLVSFHVLNVSVALAARIEAFIMAEIGTPKAEQATPKAEEAPPPSSDESSAGKAVDGKGVSGRRARKGCAYATPKTWLLCAVSDGSLRLRERLAEEVKHAGGKVVLEAFYRWAVEDKCRLATGTGKLRAALLMQFGAPSEHKLTNRTKDKSLAEHGREVDVLWTRHYFHRAARLGKTIEETEAKKYGKTIEYYDAAAILSIAGEQPSATKAKR
jgi:hypothetical protein